MADMLRRLAAHLRRNRVPLLKGGLRIVLVLLLVVVVVQIFAPATYRLAEGLVTFQLAPSWPGGRVIMPLGPAGVLQLATHHTPVNLKLDFTLNDSVPSVSEAQALLSGLPGLRPDAVAAFYSFLESRLPWLLLLGALAGVLVANGGPRWLRRTLLHALYGVGLVALLTAVFVGATLLTFDSTPAVQYQGLAKNLPRVVELVRRINADSGVTESGIDDFVRGIQTVAAQLDSAAHAPSGDVTRVLVVSDVHDNVVGMLLATSLAKDEVDPFSLVLLAGDITTRGTKPEAQLFTREFSSDGLPVLMVGGNHEDAPALKVFARANYRLLDGAAESVDGLRVFGVTDPMARSLAATPDEELLAAGGAAALDRFQRLEPPPQVFLVHDPAEARPIIDYAKAKALPLTVVYGHDHVAAVKRDGTVTLVDGGTSGASGYLTLGQQGSPPYTFQILDFSKEPSPRLLSVTTLSYESLFGKSTATYAPIAR
jgi:predicted phosphodiesterase